MGNSTTGRTEDGREPCHSLEEVLCSCCPSTDQISLVTVDVVELNHSYLYGKTGLRREIPLCWRCRELAAVHQRLQISTDGLPVLDGKACLRRGVKHQPL